MKSFNKLNCEWERATESERDRTDEEAYREDIDREKNGLMTKTTGGTMSVQVGWFDWNECDRCTFYREVEGGCNPLEKDETLLRIDIELEAVFCDAFYEK